MVNKDVYKNNVLLLIITQPAECYANDKTTVITGMHILDILEKSKHRNYVAELTKASI